MLDLPSADSEIVRYEVELQQEVASSELGICKR